MNASWYDDSFKLLACPRDNLTLDLQGSELVCANQHRYPIIKGIPVMLIEEAEPTHIYCCETLKTLQTVPFEEHRLKVPNIAGGEIDSFVQEEIVGTCGHMYRSLQGHLTRYPIPDDLPLEEGKGRTFLDIGSNWGRWAIAAAKRGYKSIGLDPSLEAVMALQRVSQQLCYPVLPIVGDARFLPFRRETLDVVFSYSVLQHFDKKVARRSVIAMSRICKPGGTILVQMPNKFGSRQIFNHFKQYVVCDRNPFRVRYWSPRELKGMFESVIGPTTLSVDCFFSLNARRADKDMLPGHYAALVQASLFLKRVCKWIPWLVMLADSLWVNSIKEETTDVRHLRSDK